MIMNEVHEYNLELKTEKRTYSEEELIDEIWNGEHFLDPDKVYSFDTTAEAEAFFDKMNAESWYTKGGYLCLKYYERLICVIDEDGDCLSQESIDLKVAEYDPPMTIYHMTVKHNSKEIDLYFEDELDVDLYDDLKLETVSELKEYETTERDGELLLMQTEIFLRALALDKGVN